MGQRGWLRYAGGEGPAGPTGPKAECTGKVSRAKSEEEGFLNLPRLWKFAQGDLGGILT
jgi:hypothetical protein